MNELIKYLILPMPGFFVPVPRIVLIIFIIIMWYYIIIPMRQ